MNPRTVYFAIPGNLATLTGGYGYDRKLLTGLRQFGVTVVHHMLDASFPFPTSIALNETSLWLQMLPDNSIVLIDGLASLDTISPNRRSRIA